MIIKTRLLKIDKPSVDGTIISQSAVEGMIKDGKVHASFPAYYPGLEENTFATFPVRRLWSEDGFLWGEIEVPDTLKGEFV